jgi:hypothetical protein
VLSFADKLVGENHYASDKIQRKADSLAERRDANRVRALEKLNRLKDFLHLQKFFQVKPGDLCSKVVFASIRFISEHSRSESCFAPPLKVC